MFSSAISRPDRTSRTATGARRELPCATTSTTDEARSRGASTSAQYGATRAVMSAKLSTAGTTSGGRGA
ncbi:hypothetical protein DT87_21275 [Streptomyces sp. NTK 937]|nr:hypothetical protein DT87_21275 [Streptomyces sp. NTK 937]